MRNKLALKTARIRNFKAICDSGTIKFTPLTVFIGNNGSGKSSVVEGLETLQTIVEDDLDSAMEHWRGFEFIWNRASPHSLITTEGRQRQSNSMMFEISGSASGLLGGERRHRTFRASSEITAGVGANEVFFLRESLRQEWPGQPSRLVTRLVDGSVGDQRQGSNAMRIGLRADRSVLLNETSLGAWQFLRLSSDGMGNPVPMQRSPGRVPLAVDGSNVADFLAEIYRDNRPVFEGIVETLQVVLPYAATAQPVFTSELGRSVYLQLWEKGFHVPGWLFSTGTLRILALLALFRHPDPPPLIVIEEIENGLDPRSIGLIVDEIRDVVSSGRSQIILTTHSPYLLDLVPLQSLIFVERVDGQPTFTRPADNESVERWSQDFAPGRLYTMGKFRRDA